MYGYFKRFADFFLSLSVIIVLFPVFAALFLLIKLDSEGAVIFKQKRLGRNKVFFDIYKFRTMRVDTPKDIPTHLLTEPDKYITGMGRFLRKTSLDELPQLFNILKGDMSIVGPRPALWNQDDLIELRDRCGANDLYPGLTGLAQVMGRDELPVDVKAEYDGIYVKKMSLIFDIKIVLMTIGSVLSASGVREGK
jgi:O-antigen biosynthesis protein WbqP